MEKNNKKLYVIIRDDIINKIELNIYKEGELIPTEAELREAFNVSRVTVRRALEDLEKEHYIDRKPGYGTVVKKSNERLKNFTIVQSFTAEMKERGVSVKTIDAKLELIKANYWLANKFGIDEGAKLYCLKRIRGTTDPILYSITYFIPLIEFPNNKEFLYGSLYQFLTNKNIMFSYVDEVVSSVFADDDIISKLKVNKYTPILRRDRLSYDTNNKLLEYTNTYYVGTRYEYRTKINYHKQ